MCKHATQISDAPPPQSIAEITFFCTAPQFQHHLAWHVWATYVEGFRNDTLSGSDTTTKMRILRGEGGGKCKMNRCIATNSSLALAVMRECKMNMNTCLATGQRLPVWASCQMETAPDMWPAFIYIFSLWLAKLDKRTPHLGCPCSRCVDGNLCNTWVNLPPLWVPLWSYLDYPHTLPDV